MQFRGTVIHGDGYGRQLGYPTANIDQADFAVQKLTPKEGIYAGEVEICKTAERYLAAIVIGPTQPNGRPKLEAHLLDFTGELYGETIVFYVYEFIRSFQKYDDEEALIADIRSDIDIIKTKRVCSPAS
ncbi:riboflavin kinase [Candidatus Pacebacteria bacterium]|nr:riboflavin kinase [Candidatus Paceibacterota bacterium]